MNDVRTLLGGAVAGLVLGVVGVLAVGGVAPAGAEPVEQCATDGARVVIEFGDLVQDDAQRVSVACDDQVDGERADRTLADAGVDLTYATRSAGFVCRVSGLPASDPCVNAAPADAYWSVWWAAPGGDWVYSSLGVSALRTPAGGDVALVWHQGAGKAQPPRTAPGSSVTPASTAADAAPAGEDSDEGLPVWVPAAVVAGVVVLGGAVALRRRNG